MCNQLVLQFSMDHFETLHSWCGYIEDVHVNFCRQKIIFDKIRAFSNFEISLQQRVASLCNQLLPGFSSNQFETLHRYYKHIEDVHVTFNKQEKFFDKITAFWTLTIFSKFVYSNSPRVFKQSI